MISKKYMLILGLLITVVDATSAKAKPLPPGSYKATCFDILLQTGISGVVDMVCACRLPAEIILVVIRNAYFFPYKCESNRDIANRNGHLVCE